MKTRSSKSKPAATAKAKTDKPPITAIVQSDCPQPEVLLAAAMNEPKRVLLMDFIRTINTLRDEKKFTFRAIADWFAERGIETDHSAVYRAYLAAVPPQHRNPDEDWSEVEEFDAADVNVGLKKS